MKQEKEVRMRRSIFRKGMYLTTIPGRVWILLTFIFLGYFISHLKQYTSHFFQVISTNFDSAYAYNPNRPHYCCTVFQGGLGNLLFQYAFSYAIARDKNLTLIVSEHELGQLQQVFQIPNMTKDERGRHICQKSKKLMDEVDVGLDPNLLGLPNNTDLRFEGYFQSWVYWREYEEELREQIKFLPHIVTTANHLIDEQLQVERRDRKKVTLVGIHIRRGDMITNNYFKNYGYQVADEAYLKKAMQYIEKRVKGEIVYVICSNDMVWARQAISVPNAVFINGTKREYDMAALTLCDHFIMTVGTFGWWTGFLSRGIIIYYDSPFRPGTDLAKNWAPDYKETFFFPNWIGMS